MRDRVVYLMLFITGRTTHDYDERPDSARLGSARPGSTHEHRGKSIELAQNPFGRLDPSGVVWSWSSWALLSLLRKQSS